MVTKPFWNFSAGPSKLPTEVLQQAAAEMLDWQGSGMSVMEMSHRGSEFTQICDEAEADLRTLLAIPDNYAVLFMQGGASGGNAILPMNLLHTRAACTADYLVTGVWSAKSYQEAARYGQVNLVASNQIPQELGHQVYEAGCWLPPINTWQVNAKSSYLHICTNETIGGLEIDQLPDRQALGVADVPLALDMSSHFLSRPFDVSQAGVIYAGAQKNAGPAGVTVVIVRRDLLGKAQAICPSAFDYSNIARERSRFNTPPSYSIYICGLVFKWLLKQGGLAAIEQANITKAEALYKALDESQLYHNGIQKAYRSRMNVAFFLRDESLNTKFLEGAQAAGLAALKGHKSVGGMRASIYNAMPLEGVLALIDYLKEFERVNG